jgi:hypothetical protein
LCVQLAQFVGLKQAMPTLTFFSATSATDNTENADSISTISAEVFEALSELAFDEDGLEMDEEDYYSEESPDPTPLIESVLTKYADRVTKALREGRLTDALIVYMGVYKGTHAATEPQTDEFVGAFAAVHHHIG